MNLELHTIAIEVTKTIVAVGSRLLEGSISKVVADSQNVEEHLRKTTNEIGYFVTHRAIKQNLDNAYIHPDLIDGCLSMTHLPAKTYQSYRSVMEQSLKNGALPSHHTLAGVPGLQDAGRHYQRVDLEALIKDETGCVVLAEPGSGKTSLLAYLCFSRLNNERPALPLFISSQMLDKSSLEIIIDGLLEPLGMSIDREIRLGTPIYLYVDGLDEIEKSEFKRVCFEIRQLAAQAPTFCVTAACRSSAYHNELSFLKEITILPFDLNKVSHFVEAWFMGTGKDELAKSLIREIEKNQGLAEIGRQPLMLSLMCNAYYRYLKVSRRLSTLFDQCIAAMMWEWDADRNIRRQGETDSIDLAKSLWLHSRLAVSLHQQGERFVSKQRISFILRNELPRYGVPGRSAELVLAEFCSNIGILTKFTEDTYGFTHLALQEFLTAKWFASESRWKELLTVERLKDSRWKEVLALTAACLSDSTQFLSEMLNVKADSDIVILSRVATCLKQDPIVAEELRASVWRRTLSWYHDGDIAHHNAACEMLADVDDGWTIPIVMTSLSGKVLDKTSSQVDKRSVIPQRPAL